MSNPCRLYPHCQIGLSAVVGCRARWLQISGDVVLDIMHCVLYVPFWPGGFLLACSSLCLVGIHFGRSVDLDEQSYARIGGRGILPGLLVWLLQSFSWQHM